MKCPACGHENRENAKFCAGCAAPLKRTCSSCGEELQPGAKFCDECAAPVSEPVKSAIPERDPLSYTPRHLAEKILTSRSALEGERKTITALFADIKGSMELLEDLDPEEARRVIDPALQLMMDAVHRYEGYVAQSTGDGIFALFGAPIAHEDHPQRALYAALLMQEEIGRYRDKLQLEKGVPIHIRVGLNTGEVVLRSIRKDDLHADYAPVGHSTSLAARMESMAAPGTIVVSEHTHKLTEGYFQFKALGPAKVKGVTEPVEVYEVAGVGPLRSRFQVAARRGLVRFVGRHAELEQMRRAWESAKASRGQIVAVMGEAGVGKSRLVYEFKVPLESQCLVLEAFSVSHGKAHAYLPLIDLLKSYFEITLGDDEQKRREKLGGKVLMLDRTLEDTLPYLFTLLGIAEPASSLAQMDSQIRRQRTLESIKRLLVRESLRQPLLLIFEDLHWIDGETQAFLDVLADSVATAKILLLVNYRPQYQHGWASKTYYTRLRLDPLGRDEAEELLKALLGEGTAARAAFLGRLILEKTEGNPFFMEEVVQALAEEGVLAGERGRYRLEESSTDLHVPATVQGVLAARIDRLPAEEKTLVQTLAVIGKEFPLGLVRRVTEKADEDLHMLLSNLQTGEFIYEQPAFPEPEYTFKHALTQEVAYQSLLIERRKALHERTAEAMEALYADNLDEHYGALAHHYRRTDNTRKAVEYLHLAGEQAVRRSAHDEATSQLTAGLELLRTLPETPDRAQQELLLQMALGPALMATRGWAAPEVESVYARARELCAELGDARQLFVALFAQWAFHQVRGQLHKARELAEQLLRSAPQRAGFLSACHHALGVTLCWAGDFRQAQEHLERADALYDERKYRSAGLLLVGIDPRVSYLSYRGRVLAYLGYLDQALNRSNEALNLAREMAHPLSLATGLDFTSFVHLARGEVDVAREQADALITLSVEHGFTFFQAWGPCLRGMALEQQGHVHEGITQIQQGWEAVRRTGAWLSGSYFALPAAYGRGGQAKQGLALVVEMLDHLAKTGEHSAESSLCRIKGDLLLVLSDDNHSEAESCFREAIAIARRQSAKFLELQAATSLCRLWQRQGKKEEARQLLGEIYGWFTEGLDTRDLKEAKALLGELS